VRPTWAEVDLDAVAGNVAAVAEVSGTPVCAVVKADGYGHGAVPVARAALSAGAAWLAVALVEEGLALREAGIDAPVLILSEPLPSGLAAAHAGGLTPTIATRAGVRAAAAHRGWPVHLKVDTGMHRVGCEPAEAPALAVMVGEAGLELGGVWTHLAVADEPGDPFTAVQLERFEAVLGALAAARIDPGLRHAANSAAAIAHPAARYDLVRVGIATYGVAPSPELDGRVGLRPALRLRSAVSAVRTVAPGEGVSYGRRWRATVPTVVATVPIGYADGVRRSWGTVGGTVLLHGTHRPVVGVVSMDQLMVDAGDLPVAVGDEVVLLGRQAGAEIAAAAVAARLDTIPYEILCAVGARVPRRYGGGPG
jgi:alanine racemase